jgi:hypothetical protein
MSLMSLQSLATDWTKDLGNHALTIQADVRRASRQNGAIASGAVVKQDRKVACAVEDPDGLDGLGVG